MKHGPLFCLALFFLLISLSNADTKPCVECMDQEVLKAVFAKNRFDKNDPDIIRGKYVRHGDKVLDNPAYAISGYMDIADAPLNACLKTNVGASVSSASTTTTKSTSPVWRTPIPRRFHQTPPSPA